MAETTMPCKICLKGIKVETFLSNQPQLSTFSTEAELTINESVACNECKDKIDETYQAFMKNETDNVVHPLPINENIVKDEYLLFNSDIPICVEECKLSDTLYHCHHCNYTTNDKNDLIDHLYTHRFKCNLCSYTTLDSSSLNIHKETHFNVRLDENFVLRLFKPNSEDNTSTQPRKTKHCGESSYRCNQCNYKSGNETNLIQHMFEHSVERPYKCNLCNFKCRYESHLIQHIGTHSKEKPFKCKLCDFSCSASQSLQRHMCKHSGEWPYKCNKCNFKSSYKGDLNRHNKTHTKEKTFKCKLCDYTCIQSKQLTIHLYKHSGEWPYMCDKCDYKTGVKSSLIRHISVHNRHTKKTISMNAIVSDLERAKSRKEQ